MRKNYLIILVLSLLFVNFVNSQHLQQTTKITLPKTASIHLTPYGKLSFAPINEASGLVKSRLQENVFWTHNDSGDRPRIFPVTKDGDIIKANTTQQYSGVFLENAKNVDWEDITTDDKGNLIIGDCGNNKNKRKNLALYIINEPLPAQSTTANIIKKITFYYPDQQGFPPEKRNFDSEALFWARGKIYLLTKHRSDNFTKLYRLDSVDSLKSNPLTLISRFEIHDQVTAADASLDGKKLAVLTFSAVWLFEVSDSSDNYFAGKIWYLPISANQCEAICFDDNSLIIANEQRELFELQIDSLIAVRDL